MAAASRLDTTSNETHLQDSLRGLQINMEESSNKLQEQLQKLQAGVRKVQTVQQTCLQS